MTTNEIINLDYREKKNQEIIQKALRKIKPLSKYSEEYVPYSALEKVINIMSKKYNVRIREITQDIWANESNTIWKATIINDDIMKTNEVYGLSLYEILAKSAVKIYAETKKIRGKAN